MSDKELVRIEENLSVPALLKAAVEQLGGQGAESVVAAIKELVALQRDQEKWNAEKEFNDELRAFQAECPQIAKNSKVDYVSKKGGRVQYNYTQLDSIMKIVKPLLHPRGFSISWDTETILENNRYVLKAKVRLLHRNGHSIKSHFSVPVSEEIGSMNEVQRHAGVKTYAIRNCLVDVLGLITTEEDTDAVDPTKISTEEAIRIQRMVKEAGMDEAKFLRFMDVEQYTEIRQVQKQSAYLAMQRPPKQPPKAEQGELV